MTIDEIKQISILELSEIIANKFNDFSIEELFNCFNDETIRKIELLDKDKTDMPNLTALFQAIENKVSEHHKNTPPIVSIIDAINASKFDYASNCITLELLKDNKAILYPQHIAHENSHSDTIVAVQYQESNNKDVNTLMQNNAAKLRQWYSSNLTQGNTNVNIYNESTLKQLYLSNITDTYLEILKQQYEALYIQTQDIEYYKEYEKLANLLYVSPTELVARQSELEMILKEYDIAMKETNLKIRAQQLSKIIEHSENKLQEIQRNKHLTSEYVKLCGQIIKSNNLPERKIFNSIETAMFVYNKFFKIENALKKIIKKSKKKEEQAKTKIDKYSISKKYNQIKNATKNILKIANENCLPNYEKIINHLVDIDVLFDENYFRYANLRGNNQENNIAFMINELKLIYDKLPAEYTPEQNEMIKFSIDNILNKLFICEGNIYMLNDLDGKTINWLTERFALNETTKINQKLLECQVMTDINNGKSSLHECQQLQHTADEILNI